MLWKCEIRNSYARSNVWTEVEIVGDDFLTELHRRFGKIEYRNLYQLDTEKNEWVKINYEKKGGNFYGK